MSVNIVQFIKKLLPTYRKSEFVEDIRTSKEYLVEVSVPAYISLEEAYKASNFISDEVKNLINTFYKNLKIDSKNVKLVKNNIATDIKILLNNAILNADYCEKELDEVLGETIVSHALTLYKAFLLRSVGHFSFIAKFSTDLINYIYIKEIINDKDANYDASFNIPKKKEEDIKKNMWIFAKLLAVYGLPKEEFKELVVKVPDMVILKDEAEKAISLHNIAEAEPLVALPDNFVGSPIYTIRLAYATWQAERYRELKDKKKLLELRYLHYKYLKEKGEGDAMVEKEIMYLQKRINELDYKLAKMEESVE
jgi:hypothetical protein